MDRKDFIQSLIAVSALQAIPGSLMPVDINHVQALPKQFKSIVVHDAIRLHDILISPDGEAYVVTAITDDHKHIYASVIDGREDTDNSCDLILTQAEAQAMICHDWDDLDA